MCICWWGSCKVKQSDTPSVFCSASNVSMMWNNQWPNNTCSGVWHWNTTTSPFISSLLIVLYRCRLLIGNRFEVDTSRSEISLNFVRFIVRWLVIINWFEIINAQINCKYTVPRAYLEFIVWCLVCLKTLWRTLYSTHVHNPPTKLNYNHLSIRSFFKLREWKKILYMYVDFFTQPLYKRCLFMIFAST